ncbi:myo-inositol-1(or 4)-monophosphatase [Candidatus Kinetoplastibacterium oncopeltii TCC290E]|uniref:Inositol-1-monophosphatase n=1 Tax=Candidatus Kinetoplastidibacterium stringomonadis TCC290E TaxID=1208920 RepID=M1LVM3_9PROT|nr:inositol monophosphatase family protein [Candidatus Kinetoplastibacterium oncopeltii]AGF48136.1 myo-inositol-1(or 4)-monophosphatase [Candidatus Kinetoplastibacterium oncopeltii TCC290E]
MSNDINSKSLRLSNIQLSNIMDIASDAAKSGAKILQYYFHHLKKLIVHSKNDNDLFSQADKESERAIIDKLTINKNKYGIITEESGGNIGETATWYIDPLDGSTNFIHGIPHYSISIALVAHAGAFINEIKLEKDTPILGVIYDPCRDEIFTAILGHGALLNGKTIKCSNTKEIGESIVSTGLPYNNCLHHEKQMSILKDILKNTRSIRRMGSAALDLAWIACGRYDGYWEFGLSAWDVAAGTIILREADGICEDITKINPWPSNNGWILAGNKSVYIDLLNMIKPTISKIN